MTARPTSPPLPPELAVHLIAPSPAGGAESVVLALAAAAPQRTRVITINQYGTQGSPPLALTRQLRDRGVTVEEVRCGRRQYRGEARAVAALLVRWGAQVLHTHGYHGTIVGWLARWSLGAERRRQPTAARVPRVVTVATAHGYLGRDAKERLYDALDRWVMRRFDATIAVSRPLEALLLAHGHRRDRLHVIRNGMPAPAALRPRAEARALLGLPAEGSVVGWIGRLSVEKGADLFIEAVAASPAGGTRAVVVGDGPERPALEALARSRGVADRVHFAGAQPDAARLLAAFDVLALSSRTEGTPMVILEAVQAGVPIASFRVGGIPDLLDDASAWLVALSDVRALGGAVHAALSDPDEARTRAARARTRLEAELSTAAWLDRTWSLYRSLLGDRQR